LDNQRSNIAKIAYIARRCFRTGWSTSSVSALLLLAVKVHLYQGD